jgi:hypothetical protein
MVTNKLSNYLSSFAVRTFGFLIGGALTCIFSTFLSGAFSSFLTTLAIVLTENKS